MLVQGRYVAYHIVVLRHPQSHIISGGGHAQYTHYVYIISSTTMQATSRVDYRSDQYTAICALVGGLDSC